MVSFPGTGPKGGLEQNTSSVIMMILVMGPLYAFWFALQIFIPKPEQATYAIVGIVAWAAYVVLYYAYAKSDSASYEAFPQSTWWFDRTHFRRYDLLVAHDGWQLVKRFKDGRVAYLVKFLGGLEYEDPELGEAKVWSEAYWVCPVEKDDTFTFVSGGEIFHKNIAVSHRAGSPVSLHVIDWEEEQGKWRPICTVVDSGYHFEQSFLRALGKVPVTEKYEALKTVYNYMAKRHIATKEHNVKLEGELDALYKLSYKVDDLLHLRLQDLKRWYGHILRAKTSWRTRILNVRTLALVLLGLGAIFVIGRFLYHWW